MPSSFALRSAASAAVLAAERERVGRARVVGCDIVVVGLVLRVARLGEGATALSWGRRGFESADGFAMRYGLIDLASNTGQCE